MTTPEPGWQTALGEGTRRGKTITSLQVVDGGSLSKNFFSRGAKYCGVLLLPIKDVVVLFYDLALVN